MTQVPILAYHNVGVPPVGTGMRGVYVTSSQLDRQMWILQKLGFCGVSMSGGLACICGQDARRAAVITFDDGYLDNLREAVPILKHYGFSATCYLVSDFIGSHNRWDCERLGTRKPLMSHADVEQWLAAGMEIGSHTSSHTSLHTLDEEAAAQEIMGSRVALQTRFGTGIEHFCYPYGRYNSRFAEVVKRAGYSTAVTLRRGFASVRSHVHMLPRVCVQGDESSWMFLMKVATPYENLRARFRPDGAGRDAAT